MASEPDNLYPANGLTNNQIPEQFVVSGMTVALDLRPYFGEVGANRLTFKARSLPDGLSIDPATGIISGKAPLVVARKTVLVSLSVRDADSGLATVLGFPLTILTETDELSASSAESAYQEADAANFDYDEAKGIEVNYQNALDLGGEKPVHKDYNATNSQSSNMDYGAFADSNLESHPLVNSRYFDGVSPDNSNESPDPNANEGAQADFAHRYVPEHAPAPGPTHSATPKPSPLG